MSEKKKRHYITLKVKVVDYWLDIDKKIIHALMNIGNKLVLIERNFDGS